MPILKPEIQAALRAAGLAPQDQNRSLTEELDASGLSVRETLDTVTSIMIHGESDHTRLRAAELSLKARGVLKDAAAPIPSITIVINDPLAPRGINPILIPRELTV